MSSLQRVVPFSFPECVFLAASIEKRRHCSEDTRHDGGHREPGKHRKGERVWCV